MSDFWRLREDPEQLARIQHAFNANVNRAARDWEQSQAHAKDEAARRAIERVLAAGLTDLLRTYPDVFAATKLSPATVDEYAARFAAQI